MDSLIVEVARAHAPPTGNSDTNERQIAPLQPCLFSRLSPIQPWSVEQQRNFIEHVSTQDADFVVRNGEFPAKNASEEKHFGINDFRRAGAAIETYEEKVLL